VNVVSLNTGHSDPSQPSLLEICRAINFELNHILREGFSLSSEHALLADRISTYVNIPGRNTVLGQHGPRSAVVGGIPDGRQSFALQDRQLGQGQCVGERLGCLYIIIKKGMNWSNKTEYNDGMSVVYSSY